MSLRSLRRHAVPLFASALLRTAGHVVTLARWLMDAQSARVRLARDLAYLHGMDERQLTDLGLGRGDVAKLAAGNDSRHPD